MAASAESHMIVDQLQNEIVELKRQLSEARLENHALRQRLATGEGSGADAAAADGDAAAAAAVAAAAAAAAASSLPSPCSSRPRAALSYSSLSNAHIERYSRQVLAGVGVEGQRKLLRAKVLLVGAGGIGSSCLLYLAGCGIGQLDVMDGDAVEVSNLHRQIIHITERCMMPKAVSAQIAIRQLNPTIRCEAIVDTLTHNNAMELLDKYDVLVDATDNPLTRYLINDAAILLSRTKEHGEKCGRVSVVFASAVATEAQLTVFVHEGTSANRDESGASGSGGGGGCCYRCLYPNPSGSVAANCASCSDAGVLGPVPGLVGVLQATEVIKLVSGIGTPLLHHILQYDALSCRFLRLKKPARRSDCASCGEPGGPSTSTKMIQSMRDSYESLRLVRGPNSAMAHCPVAASTVQSVSPSEYYPLWRDGHDPDRPEQGRLAAHPHLLLDVREAIQYDLCHLPGSVNVPLRHLSKRLDEVLELAAKSAAAESRKNDEDGRAKDNTNDVLNIYCLCRRGIASTSAASLLAEFVESSTWLRQMPGQDGANSTEKDNSSTSSSNDGGDDAARRTANNGFPKVAIWNVRGGLDAWREEVDPAFPKY
jgi:adenylyltransferase and sulfurtransferase